MDEPLLRRRIRDKIATGQLPRQPPAKVWAGTPTRRTCAACDLVIEDPDIEVEVEIVPGETLYLHRRCHEVWSEERARIA
jgi:hypothetical protein